MHLFIYYGAFRRRGISRGVSIGKQQAGEMTILIWVYILDEEPFVLTAPIADRHYILDTNGTMGCN